MAKVGEFRRCLEEQKLPSELIQWCETVLGIETLSDFVNLVTISGYEAELDTTIIQVCDHTKAAPNRALLLSSFELRGDKPGLHFCGLKSSSSKVSQWMT